MDRAPHLVAHVEFVVPIIARDLSSKRRAQNIKMKNEHQTALTLLHLFQLISVSRSLVRPTMRDEFVKRAKEKNFPRLVVSRPIGGNCRSGIRVETCLIVPIRMSLKAFLSCPGPCTVKQKTNSLPLIQF